jgi:hypothetical protein
MSLPCFYVGKAQNTNTTRKSKIGTGEREESASRATGIIYSIL